MYDQAELESRWRATPVATSGRIYRLVRRSSRGVHDVPGAFVLCPRRGVVGDRWLASATPHPEAQVSFIERRVVELIAGAPDRWHVPGDNVVVDYDLSVTSLPVGARLVAGDAIVQITAKPHAGCDTFRSRLGADTLRWVNDRSVRDRRLRGVYARVLVGGTVRLGDHLRRA